MRLILLILYMMFSLNNLINTTFFTKQLIFYISGFIIYFILKNIKQDKIYRYIFIIYLILNVLLLYLIIFGKYINGSRAWINIFSFSFQPSELMKIVLIILLSNIVNEEKYKLKVIILTLIPSILTFLEPDTGNVIFYLIIMFTILFLRGFNKKRIIIFMSSIILFLLCNVFIYLFHQKLFISIYGSSMFYRIDRVMSFIDGNNYQQSQGIISIGTSKLFKSNDEIYIPFSKTDFIFSYMVHHIGVIFTIIYLLINLIFNLTLIKDSYNKVGIKRNVLITFLFMKITNELIHILMNIGLFPITGITLPFISYGGSSLLSLFIIMGIIDNNKEDNLVGIVDMVGMDC